jgi:hypothetical protein
MEGARISGLGADGSTDVTVNSKSLFCVGTPDNGPVPVLRFTPGGKAPDTMLQRRGARPPLGVHSFCLPYCDCIVRADGHLSWL